MKAENLKIEDLILDESFQRYILHKSPSPSEVKYWDNWISKHPEAVDEIESAKEFLILIMDRRVKPDNKLVRSQVYAKLLTQINKENETSTPLKRKIKFKYYWYAASLFLIISFAILFLKYGSTKEDTKYAGQFLEVIVPIGQRSQLVLPDGTKVWLNSGSVFKYPVDFLKQGRNVYIEGEAFFNVKHDRNIPFFVHLKEKLTIKVLGTEFNIKCYAAEKVIETTLIKGSIRLIQSSNKDSETQEISLHPSERAIYNKNNHSLNIHKLLAESDPKQTRSITREKYVEKIDPITAWKEDELVFGNETFEEIAIKMERWFGIRIIINDDQLKKERFTGKFADKETIYQVLDIFNRSEPILYTSNNKEVIITRRSK